MLSIIVPWRARAELRTTADSILSSAQSVGGEVVIVNFGGDGIDLKTQLANFPKIRIVNYRSDLFNKPQANNLGVWNTAHEFLFFCDCDIMLSPSVLRRLLSQVSQKYDVFGTVAGVQETAKNSRGAGFLTRFGYQLHLVCKNGREVRITDNEEDAHDGTRQAPGLLLVRRHHFLAINGYNSALDGWGWEDQDIICRLILGLGLHRVSDGIVMHVSHSDEARVQAYPQKDRWSSRDRMFRKALSNYDKGNFLGSYTMDIRRFVPAE